MSKKIKIPETSPLKAWESLARDADAVLVDVRTRAEWYFVGGPNLESINKQVIRLEWRNFPDKVINPVFAEELASILGDEFEGTIYFICRSGARSLLAAQAVALAANGIDHEMNCVNVAEGFEGDPDDDQRRGNLNGWKKRELPWRQT